MADSENSRTLPSCRYRNLLSDTSNLLSEMAAEKSDENSGGTSEALAKWAAWWLAHADYSQLAIVQQQLEGELFGSAKEPITRLSARQARNTPFEIAENVPLSGKRNTSRGMHSCAEEFAASDRQWDGDGTVAHDRARVAEDAAASREQLLAADLWSVLGKSAVSAMAKLHCLLEQGEPVPDSGEFPWPQIRSALADLLRASTTAPATFPDFRERQSVARLS